MKVRTAVLMTLAAAVTLASVAAAGPEAAKQRVAIDMKFHTKTFVLTPLQAGALKRDSGTMLGGGGACRKVIRDGLKSDVCPETWTLTGKRGTFTTRGPVEWRDGGSPDSCGVAFGSWKVGGGTGEYAGITGGGLSAYDAHCSKWYAHYEGLLTSP